MKALRLSALLLILLALVVNASATSLTTIDLLCGSSSDPTLCDQVTGDDIGCTEFCDASCNGFINVTAACVPRPSGYRCVCHGDPIP